jgi:hypothetical protein
MIHNPIRRYLRNSPMLPSIRRDGMEAFRADQADILRMADSFVDHEVGAYPWDCASTETGTRSRWSRM